MLDRETLREELFVIERKLEKAQSDPYWRGRFVTVLSQLEQQSDEVRSHSDATRSSITGY